MVTLTLTLIHTMGISPHHHTLPKPTPSPSPLQTTALHLSPTTTSSTRRRRSATHVTHARRGLSSRTGRLDKRERREKKGGGATTVKEEEEEEEEDGEVERVVSVEIDGGGMEYSTEQMPKLEGLEPNFWEGPQWDAFGFFIQYLWAFGILFGLISGGIAVATYNEGATDFKQTPAYKESIQSRDLLEEPDASTADVFEGNPTESAPSLE